MITYPGSKGVKGFPRGNITMEVNRHFMKNKNTSRRKSWHTKKGG